MAETIPITLDVKKMVAAVWRRKWMIAALVVAFTTLSYLVVDRVTPRYTAETTLVLRSQTSQIIQNEGFLAIPRFEAAYIVSEVDLMYSPQLVRRVMNVLRLFGAEEFNGQLVDEPSQAERGERFARQMLASVIGFVGFDTGPVLPDPEPEEQLASLPGGSDLPLSSRHLSTDWPQSVVNETMRSFYEGLSIENDGASFTVSP